MSGHIRRLDHVAIAVRDTEAALAHFRDRLGLTVVHTEELGRPRVRLTYLDVGNAYVQLVEPLDADSEVARSLAEHGEGLHHICFGVDEAIASAEEVSTDGGEVVPGSGRGRVSAFVAGAPLHGVRIEFTDFDRETDVDGSHGWLDRSTVVPAP
jgi:methylmalonyl-CoA/ethylmalonyl-CoA epimerase